MTAVASRPLGYFDPGRVYPRSRLREGYARRAPRRLPPAAPAPVPPGPGGRVITIDARADTLILIDASMDTLLLIDASDTMSLPFTRTMFRGEDVTLRFTFPVGTDVTGQSFEFGLSPSRGGVRTVTKAATGSGRNVDVSLVNADTAAIPARDYAADLRRQPAGSKATVADGVLTIRREVVA